MRRMQLELKQQFIHVNIAQPGNHRLIHQQGFNCTFFGLYLGQKISLSDSQGIWAQLFGLKEGLGLSTALM